MKKPLYNKVLLLCILALFASCSTMQQANCPSFKAKANKAAIAQAKLKQKEHKQMLKVKAELAEKYARNTAKTETADLDLKQEHPFNGVLEKLDIITETQIASADFVPELTFEHKRFANSYFMAKEIAQKTDNEKLKKRFEKVDKKINKIKERVNRIKAKKSPHHKVQDDARKGLIGGIMGIVAIVTIGFWGLGIGFGIAAIVLGKKGLQSENRPWALTGVILGALTVAGAVLILLIILLVLAAFASV